MATRQIGLLRVLVGDVTGADAVPAPPRVPKGAGASL